MKFTFSLLLLLSCVVYGRAQQSVNSGGGNASSLGGSVSFSIGQVVYIHFSNSNGQMNQGVQQVFSTCETVEGTDVIQSCEPITWIDGNTYSSSNSTATFVLTGAAQNGCDSLVTLNFTLLQPAQGVDVINSCGPITWIDGNTYSSSNNTATHLLVGAAQNGCDSLVTLNFTLWPCTQLGSNACNATNVALDQALFASLVGAPAYRFRIVGPNNANWVNNTVIFDRTVRWFSFNPHVIGEIAGQTYTVQVAVGDGFGNFGPYGNACNVTLGALPTTQLTSNSCNAVNVFPSTALFANQIQEALGYRFRIVGSNNGDLSWNGDTIVVTRPVRWFRFDQHAHGFIPGATYQVRVAYLTNDGVTYSPFGPMCEVTLAAPLIKPISENNDIFVDNKTMNVVEFGANASHNPFTTDFGIQVLNANDVETINVSVYDMSGKLIERNVVTPMDIESARFGANLASGMYMIEVRQGANQAVIRQVKN